MSNMAMPLRSRAISTPQDYAREQHMQVYQQQQQRYRQQMAMSQSALHKHHANMQRPASPNVASPSLGPTPKPRSTSTMTSATAMSLEQRLYMKAYYAKNSPPTMSDNAESYPTHTETGNRHSLRMPALQPDDTMRKVSALVKHDLNFAQAKGAAQPRDRARQFGHSATYSESDTRL